MKKYFSFLILLTLLICLTGLSATDTASNDTYQETSIDTYDNSYQADIQTDSVEVSKSIKKEENTNIKEKSQTIDVTSKNYKNYFQTNESKTTSNVNSGDTINLQGTFNDIDFTIDKNSITLTSIGKTAVLNNCTIHLKGTESSNSKIYNLTIHNSKYFGESTIWIENATNVIVEDNNLVINSPDGHAFLSTNMQNSTIRNNYFETTHTHSNMVIKGSDNNYIINNTVSGYANGIYLCAYADKKTNETNPNLNSNNNTISGNNVTGNAIVNICHPIRAIGENNTIEYNTVTGGGTGISSDDPNIIRYNDIYGSETGITSGNSIVENNYIHSSLKSGITASGNGSIVRNNTIVSDKTGITISDSNITIINNKVTSKNYSIYSKHTPAYTYITVTNNTLNGEVYNTGEMTLIGNIIQSGVAKEGGAIYNSGTITLTNNTIIHNNATTAGAIYNYRRGKTSNVSNNLFGYNSPSSFTIKNNKITLTDNGNFIPTDAKIGIYENGTLIKTTSMTDSVVDYTVSGTHTYNIVVNATNFTNNRFIVTNSNKATQSIITLDTFDSVNYGSTVNIGGKLLSNNKAVKNQNVTLNINNKDYVLTTDSNGKFNKSYTVNTYNNINIVASFDGNNEYEAARNTTSITKINKTATITVTAPKTITSGQTATFKVVVTDAGTNEKLNGTAIIKVNGLTLQDANGKQIQLKVVNGQATLKYALSGYSARTHKITAVFAKNGYARAENNTNMTVNKAEYATFSMTINACSEKVITINKTLKDTNGNVLGGSNKISIKVGDRTVLTTTTVNGVLNAKFTIPYLPEGKINVKITMGENNRYNMKTFNTTATIYKQNVTVSINNITAKAGSKVTLKAKLTNSETKTNVLSGKYIFKVNGNTVPLIQNGSEVITTKIISNGVAQWDYTLPSDLGAGQYNIQLVYNGNTQSNSIRYTSKSLTITG